MPAADEVSMHDDLQPPHDHALARPELAPFVAAARAQTIAGTCVTSESVAAGLEHSRRRSHAQRMLWLSVPVAVAASLVVMVVLSPLWSRDDVERVEKSNTALATAVRISSTGAPEIRDAWTVALGEGTHEIELVREPGEPSRPLHIELPGRALELIEGRATIEVVGDDAAVRLHIGVAAWIDADGRRTQIEVEQFELADGDAQDHAQDETQDENQSAALAREADRLLAAGERDQAIETLRRLVETHPNASQAPTAVLDLGRLLDTAGRDPEARCAYELHLERWPDSSVTAEVEAQLAQLGETACRGLHPQ